MPNFDDTTARTVSYTRTLRQILSSCRVKGNSVHFPRHHHHSYTAAHQGRGSTRLRLLGYQIYTWGSPSHRQRPRLLMPPAVVANPLLSTPTYLTLHVIALFFAIAILNSLCYLLYPWWVSNCYVFSTCLFVLFATKNQSCHTSGMNLLPLRRHACVTRPLVPSEINVEGHDDREESIPLL